MLRVCLLSAARSSFSKAIEERQATQHFEPTAVQEPDLTRILEAALAAPSSYNLQPWRSVVVRDPKQRKPERQLLWFLGALQSSADVAVLRTVVRLNAQAI